MMNFQNSASQYIPQQAYLYFPKPSDTKTAQGDRLIFAGNTQFDQHEVMKIVEFKDYAYKHHCPLSQIWTDGYILRFLYANGFKMDKTLHSVKEHTHWREKHIPVQIDTRLQQYLNSGILYISGRDNKFRPIVVFNINMIDPKHFDYNLITRYLTFWFELIIDQYMLPGQIENWIFIVNLKNMKVSKSATDSLKQIFGFLLENYKCRLYSLSMVNAGSTIYLPWKIIQKFLDEVTVNKIHLYKHPNPEALFQHAHPSQIEQQFGGTGPNITRFWPPQATSNNFFISNHDQQELVSVETYNSLYKQGRLQNMKVNPALIQNDQPKGAENKMPTTNEATPKVQNVQQDYTNFNNNTVGENFKNQAVYSNNTTSTNESTLSNQTMPNIEMLNINGSTIPNQTVYSNGMINFNGVMPTNQVLYNYGNGTMMPNQVMYGYGTPINGGLLQPEQLISGAPSVTTTETLKAAEPPVENKGGNGSPENFSDCSEEPDEDFNQCMSEETNGQCEANRHSHALKEEYRAESIVHQHETC